MDEQSRKEARHGSIAFPCAIYHGCPMAGGCVLYSHWHDELEIFRLDHGRVSFFVDGQSFELNPGEAVFIQGGEVHAAYSKPGAACGFTAIVFSSEIFAHGRICQGDQTLGQSIQRGMYRLPQKLTPDESWGKEILGRIESIVQENAESAVAHELAIISGLNLAFLALARHGQLREVQPTQFDSRSSRMRELKRVLGFMHERHATKISLSTIAQEAHMSVFHFSRCFKKMTGSTPLEYLVDYRIDRAEKLLLQTDRKIQDIASSVGFETVSHFIKTFRKLKQETPARFRKNRSSAR